MWLGLEGTFADGGQDERTLGRRTGPSACRLGTSGGDEDPHVLPKRPGRQQDPAVSGKAEDAGQAESIPGDRPSPVRCLDQGARSGELGAGRRPGRLGGSGNTSHLGPSPCPPHSVLGAQHPSPSLSRGGPEHTPHAWEPSSWAVRAGGQALSRGLRRGFPGRPQPGRGFRGEDARGQPRGGACRAPGGGTAAGWGHPRGRSGPGARRRWRESGKPTPGAPLPAAPLLTQISRCLSRQGRGSKVAPPLGC